MSEDSNKVNLRDYLEVKITHERELWSELLREYQRAINVAKAEMDAKVIEMNNVRRDFFSRQEQYSFSKEVEAKIEVQRRDIDGSKRLIYMGVGLVLSIQFLTLLGVGIWSLLKK